MKKHRTTLLGILLLSALVLAAFVQKGTAAPGPAAESAAAASSSALAESRQEAAASPAVASAVPAEEQTSSSVSGSSQETSPAAEKAGPASPAGQKADAPSSEPEKSDAPSSDPKKAVTPSPDAKGSATPSPDVKKSVTPEPENSLTDLKKELEKMLKKYDGTWSVYCKRLDTDESICINDTSLISASLIKLYVFGAVMDDIEKGKLDFDDWSEPLELMIEYSDNESCNILINAAGGFEAVNAFIKKQGYKNTELYRYMLEKDTIENYTSARECGKLLEDVLDGKYVSKDASELLLYHMEHQDTLYKIPAGVPENVKTANKTGELEDAEHDAAIVYSPACTYILVVMSNDLEPYYNDGISQVCEISKTVYNYLND